MKTSARSLTMIAAIAAIAVLVASFGPRPHPTTPQSAIAPGALTASTQALALAPPAEAW